MNGAPVRLSAHDLDALRGGVGTLAPETAAGLRDAGVLDGSGAVEPTVAAVLAVLSASWASLRVRTWSAAGREDLVGAVGPDGVALMVGPPGPDAPQLIGHRPRWTGVARAVGAFVDLGPSPPSPRAPRRARWAELVAAATRGPGPRSGGSLRSVDRLWDVAWTGVSGSGRPRRLVVADLGGDGLVEVRPTPGEGDAMDLAPRRPDEVWLGLCHLLREPLAPDPAAPSHAGR